MWTFYSSECRIFHLFRRVLSSLLPLRSVGRSNFDKGLHNLITLIPKRHRIMIEMKLLCCIMESTVDSKSSVGDRVKTKVAITVGILKYDGGKNMTMELKIFNLIV